MSRANPALVSFNAGELSPLLLGRPDLAKYPAGWRSGQNMVPTVQGPARQRGGMRFRANTKQDGKVWLARFRFSRQQSYILEFGHLYIRFYANRAQLVFGTPIEVATPYAVEQLTNEDGSFALSLDQSGDNIYIASLNHAPRVLRRLGATDFSLSLYATRNGPLQDQNGNKALRFYAAARTGSSVNVTASANYFTSAMVGAFLRLDVENFLIPPWEPGKHFIDGALARSDGKTFMAVNTAANPITGTTVTGSKTPIHEEGRVLDGSGETADDTPKPIGILWEFRDPGYGYAKIVSVTDALTAVVEVAADSPFPDGVVGSTNATNAWWIGAWGTHDGAEYPSRVVFWKNRLCWFGLRRFWMSVPEDYDNFARDIVGQVRTDSAITRPLETTERIRWVVPYGVLLVGTEGTEFVIRKATEQEPLGPNNITADPVTSHGSRALNPLRVGSGVEFVQPAGKRVREGQFDGGSGDFVAPDETVLAEHIANGVIVDWAWQTEPDRIIWAVLADGTLIGCTKEREQDVLAWHRHQTNGFVEAVNVISSPDGGRDDVWLVVRRTVAGVPRRFVELMDAGDEHGRAQADCYFMDCGLSYSGPAVTKFFGFDHLVGETINLVVNGGAHPPRVVQSDGSVSLQVPATSGHGGFGYLSYIQPMPINAGVQYATKKIVELVLLLYRTLGCKIGPSLDNLTPLPFRKGSDPLGQAPPLFSGPTEPIPFDGDYVQDGTLIVAQDQGLPFTLSAIVPVMSTNAR